MDEEVLEDGGPARGVRSRLLVRLWTALLDERFGLLFDGIVVSILVLVFFIFLLVPTPQLEARAEATWYA
jgi:hypothetical protein